MSNLLVGNGIIIQYGGTDYLNSDIVERAIDNIRSGRFPVHLYPKECADFVVALQKEHSSALKGNYDKYVFTPYDRSSIRDFKNRYVKTNSYSVNEIGFEDYFLLFELGQLLRTPRNILKIAKKIVRLTQHFRSR